MDAAGIESAIAGAGETALVEGIKFLYSQAAEVLRTRRSRRAGDGDGDGDGDGVPSGSDDTRPTAVEAVQIARQALEPYLSERPVPSDVEGRRALIGLMASLHRALEEATGTRVDLPGEMGAVRGIIAGRVVLEGPHDGEATGVVLDGVPQGHDVRGQVQAKSVGSGAKVTGVEIRLRP